MKSVSPADLTAMLPQPVRGRVEALRVADGIASVVLAVGGLDAAARAGLEAELRVALAEAPGITETRVAMVAERAEASRGTRAPVSPATSSATAHDPSPAAARPRLLAVASGKGGVGKSTLSANLAVALARAGRRVGLVDADIHGPSQPRLLGSEGARPEARERRLVPVAGAWGVPLLSMGHLAEAGQAIAWRGPMAGNALAQLIDAHWDDPELLVVDLPPGTGDIQLSLIKRHPPAGALIVTTPQDLALIDARRAIALFDKAGVPIVGLVENMAGYVCPHCGEESEPFGHGGAEAAARDLHLPFLGRIPLTLAIRRDSDAGTPPAAGNGAEADAFTAIAARVMAWMDVAIEAGIEAGMEGAPHG